MFSWFVPRRGGRAPTPRFCPRPAALDGRDLPSASPIALGPMTDLTPRQGHVMDYDTLKQPGPQGGTNGIWVSFILLAGNAATNQQVPTSGQQHIGSFFDIFTADD